MGKTKTRVMLDLETLGTRPGSAILSIGAVKFGDDEILDSFYERVDPKSCVDHGLKMEATTVIWWMKQADDARLEITKPGLKLPDALERFSNWVDDEDAEMWANGAGFDNPMLTAAYDAVGMPCLWSFANERCYRTVAALNPDIKANRTGTPHNALDDATSQAQHLMVIFRAGTY